MRLLSSCQTLSVALISSRFHSSRFFWEISSLETLPLLLFFAFVLLIHEFFEILKSSLALIAPISSDQGFIIICTSFLKAAHIIDLFFPPSTAETGNLKSIMGQHSTIGIILATSFYHDFLFYEVESHVIWNRTKDGWSKNLTKSIKENGGMEQRELFIFHFDKFWQLFWHFNSGLWLLKYVLKVESHYK